MYRWYLTNQYHENSTLKSYETVLFKSQKCGLWEETAWGQILLHCLAAVSPQFHLNGNINNIYLIDSLWRLNKLIHVEYLAQSLEHSKCSVNASYYDHLHVSFPNCCCPIILPHFKVCHQKLPAKNISGYYDSNSC